MEKISNTTEESYKLPFIAAFVEAAFVEASALVGEYNASPDMAFYKLTHGGQESPAFPELPS